MPRYFFNTRIGDELVVDPDGEVLRNPDREWEVARAMIACSSPRRHLLACVFLGAFSFSASAQQPNPPAAAQPLPPGSPMIGRPDNEAAAKLAPVAPPPLAAAPDKLPVAKLKPAAG